MARATAVDSDPTGPLVVGAVATKSDGTHHNSPEEGDPVGRLVAFGDSDWLNNRLAPQQGNLDLMLNTINWLAERHDKITIRPRMRARSDLSLTPKGLANLKFVSLDVGPVLLIF